MVILRVFREGTFYDLRSFPSRKAMKKMRVKVKNIGKPYTGELHVQIDEEEGLDASPSFYRRNKLGIMELISKWRCQYCQDLPMM
jgi:hypothetical protein